MNKLQEQTTKERELAAAIREAVLVEIQRRGMGASDLSELLGLLPSGAELLLQESEWPLDVGIRVAAALGLELKVSARAS